MQPCVWESKRNIGLAKRHVDRTKIFGNKCLRESIVGGKNVRTKTFEFKTLKIIAVLYVWSVFSIVTNSTCHFPSSL